MKHLRIPPLMATTAVALSLVLGGCGGSSNTTDEPDPPPTSEPMAAEGYVTLTAEQQTALGMQLDSGESQTIHVAAGGTATRAEVTFTCDSAYPCMITVTNSLGTVVAMWSSQGLGDGMASAMASGLEPAEPAAETNPLAELNKGRAGSVAAIINVAIDAAADSTATPPTPRGAYSGANNVIGGMGLNGAGVENIKGFTLTSSLNPNAADYDSTPTPPTGGSTVMVSKMEDGERVPVDYNENAPNATVALEGWSHKVLFRDWG